MRLNSVAKHSLIGGAALAVVLGICCPRALAQIKLNDPLVEGGQIPLGVSFLMSPDGDSVVYVADQDTDQVFEIYSVPTTGGTVTKLNDPMAAGGDPFRIFLIFSGNVRISPDSSRVVYRVDQDTADDNELYSVPIGGGTVTKLNDPLVTGGDVSGGNFRFSADSSRVVYTADQDTDGDSEIYSVPTTGGAVTKLNDPLVSGGDAGVFLVSPDGSRVVYRADRDTDDDLELYSVSITGGPVTELNDPLVAGGDVQLGTLISPDASQVVYLADQDADDDLELYSVSIAGGTVTKLNDPLVMGGDVGTGSPPHRAFVVSPDSSHVVYWADQDSDEDFELYSVSTTGGLVTKLNEPLVAGGDVSDFFGAPQFLISPDSGRVVYLADQDSDQDFELYSVPTTGGPVTKLNDPLVAGGDVFFNFQVSPDSSRVVYAATQDTATDVELYSVPVAGGTVTKLNDPLVAGGGVSELEGISDAGFVIYRADQDTDEVIELYAVPTSGGIVRKLSGPLAAGGNVIDVEISPDGNVIVYGADQNADEVFELYASVLAVDWDVAANGDWDTPGNWNPGFAPQKHTDVAINPSTGITVTGPAAAGTVFSLDVGATTSGTAQLVLQTDGILTVTEGTTIGARGKLEGDGRLNAVGGITNSGEIDLGAGSITLTGGTLTNNGLIRGNGEIENTLNNSTPGQVRVAAGERLVFGGAGNTNTGRMEVVDGEIEFNVNLINSSDIDVMGGTLRLESFTNAGDLSVVGGTFRTFALTTNAISFGLITARDAILDFGGAFLNSGSLGLTFGTSDVFGDILNNATGKITVSGASNATFYDDMQNDGVVQVSAGSQAVYFGVVTGTGSFPGTGTNFFEGDLQPGASPGEVTFGGDVVFGAFSTTQMEVAGAVPCTEFDRITIAGAATLDGALDVSLVNAFFPTPGETFEIMTFASRSGEFATVTGDVGLLDPVTFLLPLYTSTNLLLFTAIPGDGNLSGSVEAGDYTLWANGFGMAGPDFTDGDYNGNGMVEAGDYTLWANNFGMSVSAPADATSVVAEPVARNAVPEPSAFFLAVFGVVGVVIAGRRRAAQR